MSRQTPIPEDSSTSTTIPQCVLDKLDPEYREFVLSLPPSSRKPFHKVAWSTAFREPGEPPELGEATGLPVGSTQTVQFQQFSIKVLTPNGDKPKNGWPVLIWIHGGGWVFGHADSGVSTYSKACIEAQCVVVSVDYRLAPEHPFPAAVDDVWATLTWIQGEGKYTLGVNPGRIVVGGASAGANLAAVLAQRAALASPPIKILLQVLAVPVIDCTYSAEDRTRWSPSMVEYADIYALRALDMIWFRDLYIPDASRRSLPDATPLLQQNISVFKHLAPAWVGIAELDVLRSEGEAYAEKMRKHGVPVTQRLYKGATHLTTAADRVCKLAGIIRDDQVEAIKTAFTV